MISYNFFNSKLVDEKSLFFTFAIPQHTIRFKCWVVEIDADLIFICCDMRAATNDIQHQNISDFIARWKSQHISWNGEKKADLMSRERKSGYGSTQTLYIARKKKLKIFINIGKSIFNYNRRREIFAEKKSPITFHSHLDVWGGYEWDEKWMRFWLNEKWDFSFSSDYELSELVTRGEDGKSFNFLILICFISRKSDNSRRQKEETKKCFDCECE